MSNVDPFHVLGGYAVGIPPELVIDANGNVVTNVNAPAANVTANAVYANFYNFANGASIITTAAGSNTQVQFNNAGGFGASPNFTFNTNTNLLSVANIKVNTNANLGNVGNVVILGGINGYFLQTDGEGNLTWAPGSGGNGGNGNPGGANTQVQFNDAGTFGGDAGFTYDKNTNVLHVNAINVGNITANYITSNWDVNANVVVANYLYGDGSNISNVSAATAAVANTVSDNAQPNITSVGTLTSLNLSGNITNANVIFANNFSGDGSLLSNITAANITGDVATANYASFAGFVVSSAQPNITSVGSLTTLTVVGNTSTGNLSSAGTISTTNLSVNGTANIGSSATLRVTGNVNFANSANVNLGDVSNLHISGGVNGYVLSTDGAGNLLWVAGGGGGNGSPGGSNTQIQYNKAGTFAGSPFLTFNDSTNNVQVSGNLIANALTIGSGVFQFSYSNVYFATTNSVTPNQVLFSIEADNGVGGGNVAAVDYTIISTDGIIRNFIKISCVRSGSIVNYVEYSTLPVNGYTGDFQVQYGAGNVVSPATIQLVLSPQSANLMTHKMMITAYYD
jgi:hypothetical protein